MNRLIPSIPMWYSTQPHQYSVLRCDMPAVLVETVTLTNPDQEDWVRWDSNPSNIRLLADMLGDGVMASFEP